MIRPAYSTDPMQPNQTRLTPVYSSGPMQPRPDVQSFDLTRNSGPTRSLVTGDRSLTRNPNGRMGMPQMPGGGQSYGKIPAAGYSGQRMNSFGQPFRGNKIRGVGSSSANYGMSGYGQPQAAPQGYGAPQPPQTSANDNQPLPPALDPLANLPPPATTEEALGMPSAGAPAAASGQAAPVPMLPPLNMPWQGQPLPGGVPMRPAFAPMPWEPQETFDTTQPLPPSTLMGGAGLPPPPAYSMQQVGGFNVLTGPDGQGGSKFLNAYTDPNRGAPTPMSAAELGRIRAAGYAPAEVGGRSFDAQGVPYLQPLPPKPEPTERVTEGPTGTTRTYTQPRGQPPAAPTATPQDRVNKLMEKAGIQSTASTQTGQMPNANYAAPINPAQLLDEARNEYARTGNDTALRQYFAQYPSEAVQFTMGALNPAPQGGQRVMTQAEALRSLQPAAPVAPIQRPAAPSLIRSGPGTGIADDLQRFVRFARNNPLIELRR